MSIFGKTSTNLSRKFSHMVICSPNEKSDSLRFEFPRGHIDGRTTASYLNRLLERFDIAAKSEDDAMATISKKIGDDKIIALDEAINTLRTEIKRLNNKLDEDAVSLIILNRLCVDIEYSATMKKLGLESISLFSWNKAEIATEKLNVIHELAKSIRNRQQLVESTSLFFNPEVFNSLRDSSVSSQPSDNKSKDLIKVLITKYRDINKQIDIKTKLLMSNIEEKQKKLCEINNGKTIEGLKFDISNIENNVENIRAIIYDLKTRSPLSLKFAWQSFNDSIAQKITNHERKQTEPSLAISPNTEQKLLKNNLIKSLTSMLELELYNLLASSIEKSQEFPDENIVEKMTGVLCKNQNDFYDAFKEIITIIQQMEPVEGKAIDEGNLRTCLNNSKLTTVPNVFFPLLCQKVSLIRAIIVICTQKTRWFWGPDKTQYAKIANDFLTELEQALKPIVNKIISEIFNQFAMKNFKLDYIKSIQGLETQTNKLTSLNERLKTKSAELETKKNEIKTIEGVLFANERSLNVLNIIQEKINLVEKNLDDISKKTTSAEIDEELQLYEKFISQLDRHWCSKEEFNLDRDLVEPQEEWVI